MSVGEVDLIVGVPTYNNASTLGQTLLSVEESLRQNFVRERTVILNVDGGSADETRQLFLHGGGRSDTVRNGLTSLRTTHRISCEYGKAPSPGLALHYIVAAADLLRGKGWPGVLPSHTNAIPAVGRNFRRSVCQNGRECV